MTGLGFGAVWLTCSSTVNLTSVLRFWCYRNRKQSQQLLGVQTEQTQFMPVALYAGRYLQADTDLAVGPVFADSATGPLLTLKVSAIDRDSARVLPRKELASALGGHVLTREKNGQLVPERAIYRVALDVQDMPACMQSPAWRGHIHIHANWTSPAARYVRQAMAVLVREAGF